MNQTEMSNRLLPALALVVSSIGVGSALIFVRLSEVDPSATMMMRMFLASLIIGVINAVSGSDQRKTDAPTRLSRLQIAGGLILSSALFCADILSNHWAAAYTSVTNTTFLMNLSPVFVAAMAFFFLDERLSGTQTAALALAVAGGMLLMIGSRSDAHAATSWIGDGLALLSAAFYAIYLVLTKRIREQVGAGAITFWNSLISALMLLPLVFAMSDPILPRTPGGYAIIAALAVGTQLLGHGLMAYALRHVSATLAAVTTLSQPVLSACLAWIVLGESMAAQEIAGGALILAGLYLYSNPSLLARPSAASGIQE